MPPELLDVWHKSEAKPRFETTRNPFDSPNPSNISLSDTDDGGTSGQDEFHLERYSSNAKQRHLRQLSKGTDGEEKEKKPNLNIITSLTDPKMPMKTPDVVISEGPAKHTRNDRRNKTISVVSQKAVASSISPSDPDKRAISVRSRSRKSPSTKEARRIKPIQRIQQALAQKEASRRTQHIPIGITIPQHDAAQLCETTMDSSLPMTTPMTPAIVVTPAGEQKPWTLQSHGAEAGQRPASSIYSAYPYEQAMPTNIPKVPAIPQNVGSSHKQMAQHDRPVSTYSDTPILFDSADSARPKSQGWWNLMLSPLLRAGSVASKKANPNNETPHVPPLPFRSNTGESPALSARSDPSSLISPEDTSPDTPRRQGLASARASTWSRWTEWEQEREMNNHGSILEDETVRGRNIGPPAVIPTTIIPGLAAEYFHACAVEQATGRPYFDCLHHSCSEKLPKLRSVYDQPVSRNTELESPFKSPVVREAVVRGVASPLPSKHEIVSPNEMSPNVREARIAPVVKAKIFDSASEKDVDTMFGEQKQDNGDVKTMTNPTPKDGSTHPKDKGNIPPAFAATSQPQLVEVKINHEYQQSRSIPQPPSEKDIPIEVHPVSSPGPMSPEGTKSLAPAGDVPMSEIKSTPTYPAPVAYNHNHTYHQHLPTRPAFITADTEYPPLPDRQPTAPVTAAELEITKKRLTIEARRQRNEKEDARAKRVGGLWRGRGCFSKKGCMGRGGPEYRAKRRWIIGLSILLLAIIIICIVLATTLTRHGDGTPVDSQWLNLTGFPPMPTGILTIAAPVLASSQNQCFSPGTIWSCSVPKEDRAEIGTNAPDQPNFRFEIKFRNGTVPNNMTMPLNGTGSTPKKSAKDPFTNDLFVPNPQPPNQPDQTFIGQTTDNISAPYDGEQTPFFTTFMPTFPVVPSAFNTSSAGSQKRSVFGRDSNSSLTNVLPGPDFAPDGSAAPASLLPTTPFPISQPVRLYNRGANDEHYGFYIYYDKSIYLSGLLINGTNTTFLVAPEADQDGGSTKSQASARCTFAQTRFLVKMFTHPSFASLLPSTSNANLTSSDDAKHNKKNQTSSATNFETPGSFPYPASIIIDRHGGDIDTKVSFCYGMSGGQIVKESKALLGESRGFGGSIVNAAPSILEDPTDFNRTAGGIDGGTGGCFCQWQNWH